MLSLDLGLDYIETRRQNLCVKTRKHCSIVNAWSCSPVCLPALSYRPWQNGGTFFFFLGRNDGSREREYCFTDPDCHYCHELISTTLELVRDMQFERNISYDMLITVFAGEVIRSKRVVKRALALALSPAEFTRELWHESSKHSISKSREIYFIFN